MNTEPIEFYGHNYCVIDSHNLFVCVTLEDELLVLGADAELFGRIQDAALAFNLRIDSGRRLDAYSGGERTIICALLLLHILPRSPRNLLFARSLETLSARNRDMLLGLFARTLPQVTLFNLITDTPERLHV